MLKIYLITFISRVAFSSLSSSKATWEKNLSTFIVVRSHKAHRRYAPHQEEEEKKIVVDRCSAL